jgi:hypothetical protein
MSCIGMLSPGIKSEPPAPSASLPPARSLTDAFLDRLEGTDETTLNSQAPVNPAGSNAPSLTEQEEADILKAESELESGGIPDTPAPENIPNVPTAKLMDQSSKQGISPSVPQL